MAGGSIVQVDERSSLIEAINRIVFRDRGAASYPAQVVWRANDAANWILDADNAGGKHASFGGVLTIEDAHIRVVGTNLEVMGAQQVVFYNAGGTNTANLYHSGTNDIIKSDDSLWLATALGVGVSPGSLSAGDILAAGLIGLRAGTAFTVSFSHAATAPRVITIPDRTDTMALLAATQTFTGQNTFSNASAPIIAAKLGPSSTQQHTLPAVTSDTFVLLAAVQTLTNKTLTSPSLATPTVTGLMTLTGGQIAFPSTQSASAGANVLDDYEEGSWTPSLGGTATYSTQTGAYIKIGRLVYVWGALGVTTLGTGSTTTISGLPFSADISDTPINVSFWNALAVTPASLAFRASASTLISSGVTAGAATTASLAIFGNGASVIFAGAYRTAN